MQTWLQVFAWAEADRESCLQQRSKHISTPKREPLFCFQTAVNMWYFSAMIYRYKQVRRLQQRPMLHDVLNVPLLWPLLEVHGQAVSRASQQRSSRRNPQGT